MRKLITFAIAVLGLACCSQVGAQTTYDWLTEGNDGNQNLDANFAQQHMRFAVPASNATTANIITSRDTGCATDIIDTVQVTSGAPPQVGEYAQSSGGFQPYISEIIGVTQNSDGSYDIVLNRLTCEGFPVRMGVEQIGPPLIYNLYFSGRNGIGPQPGETCLSSSVVSADFLDSNGVLQTLTSDAGSVACTTSGSYPNLVVTGTFNGTASNGQIFTGVPFTISNRSGRYGWYALSAQWTL